jgi:hypothetical protein
MTAMVLPDGTRQEFLGDKNFTKAGAQKCFGLSMAQGGIKVAEAVGDGLK